MASKRRKNNTSAPNIPQETLERVRAQLQNPNASAANDAPVAKAEATPEAAQVATPARATSTSSASVTTRIRRQGAVKRRGGELERKNKGGMDNDTIQDWLNNPTKFPTAEELKHDYRTVTSDLRNMFILAGVLMAFLVLVTPLMN